MVLQGHCPFLCVPESAWSSPSTLPISRFSSWLHGVQRDSLLPGRGPASGPQGEPLPLLNGKMDVMYNFNRHLPTSEQTLDAGPEQEEPSAAQPQAPPSVRPRPRHAGSPLCHGTRLTGPFQAGSTGKRHLSQRPLWARETDAKIKPGPVAPG